MNSGQNDERILKITKFLSDIKSGKYSGYKIENRDDELVQMTHSALKLDLIAGVKFNEVSDAVVMIDFSNVSLTDKGLEAIKDNQGQITQAASRPQNSAKVVPLNERQTVARPKPVQYDVNAILQQMSPKDQETASSLIQALKEGRSNQLVYSDYLDFFNRNPKFYDYFINAGQNADADAQPATMQPAQAQQPTAQPAAMQPAQAQQPTAQPAAMQPAQGQQPTAQPAAMQPAQAQQPTAQPTAMQPAQAQQPTAQPATMQPAQAQQPTATPDNAANNGIFSPEVQRIISQMESEPKKRPTAKFEPAKEAPVQQPAAPSPKPTLSAEPKTDPIEQQPAEKSYSTSTTPIKETPNVQATEEEAEVVPLATTSEEIEEVSYGKKATAHVEIRYVDQDQNEIAPTLSIQLTSQTASYDVTSYEKKIHDYNFVKADQAKGKITGHEIKVVFHYEAKIAEGNIRVNYVDQQGEKIAEQKIVQGGHIGEFYPLLSDLPEKLVDQIHARCYKLQSILADNDPTDSSLIYFSDHDQNFTAIFRELVPGRITLRYRNLKNQSIGIGERVMENNVQNGDQVAIPLPLVPTGYELDKTLLNGDPVSVGDQFTVSPDQQVVDYVFKRVIADGAIVFNYVDQDGREIARQTTVRGGRYGETYDFESNLPQVIVDRLSEGVYENNPVIKEENENGTIVPAARVIFDNNDHEYSAVFQASEAATITLKFVTTDDNPIPDVTDKVVQGTHYYGDTFIIPNAPAITGFDLNRIMVNNKPAKVDDPIMYDDQEQVVTYVYTIATSTITAHHVDQLGRQIAEDRVITGQIGTSIEQSQLVSLRLNPYFVLSDVLTSGSNYTFTAEPQFITFHYQVDDDLVPDVLNVADVNLINCLDTNGNIIGRVTPSSIHLEQVKVGHVYSVHAPDFAGYHLFSQLDTVRVVWNSEKANDFIIVNHPNGLAFIYQSV
ncbi:MucBP domain-containing protein [Xylocopilactobacillus apicola]|uniref:MucBP domain-containing protein n=1 Tax=Xylocopilactobacillus apicola TaxID=2932184 RepID=A0AAU9D729_9LACO|nr:MucBP domain-containing protein [Xylocopilactobacillus apicola]BDR59679.1 hypothetical protein XA3_21200 [Xylocopilactobacillus apicola]